MRDRYTLSDAAAQGNSVIVRCRLCRTRRYYGPADLTAILGDIDCYLVERRMICAKCRQKEYVSVKILALPAEEMVTAKFRRLRGIRLVCQPIWEDER